MTIYIFHGDDQAKSRQYLNDQLNKFKQQQITTHRLNGKQLDLPQLETALTTQNLFEQEVVVIENLLSRPKSHTKQQCLDFITNYQGQKSIVFWEKKELTKTQLKAFPNAKIKVAKIPVLLWKLLDNLTPSNCSNFLNQLHRTAQTTNANFIFIMIARRVGELLIAQSGDTSKLSPWMRSKLTRQAKTWTEKQLAQLHHQLTQHDFKLKTGQTKLSYLEALDIILTNSLC